MTDPLSNVVQMTYSLRGHKLTSNDPDMGAWSYAYFPFGELKSQTDAKGQTVSFEYDRLSRLKKRTETPEGETTFVYDATSANGVGQLTSVSGPGGYSENYSYDAIGRILNRRITISSTEYNYNFTYGVHGQLDTLTYPDTIGGRLAVQYSYTKGWLQQMAQGSTVFWHADALNARGQVTQATLGNGVVRESVIDAITGLVKHIKSGLGGGYGLQNESYLYDDVGNVTQRQNGNPSLVEDFYYDNLHRLDYSKLGGTNNLDVGYDALGNITSRSDIAGGAAWTYHASKKHAVTQAGPYSYAYDANGNAITRNGHEIKWTSYNLPYEINGPGKKLTFSYGPDRQRFRQVYENGSTTETTLYLGGLLEKVEAGGVTDWRHYIVADGESVAIVSRKSSGTNATWYLLKDHVGSVAKILNSSGGEYASESFDAFGARRNPTPWSGPCPCPDLDKIKSVSRRGYTEHEMIGGQSMGLIHMNGRVQDAVIGRFLSPDPFVQAPFNGQSLNRYSYVFNNPLSHTDPSGFRCEGKDPNRNNEEACFTVDGRPGYWPVNPGGDGDHALNGLAVPRTQMRGMVFSANSPLSDNTVGGACPGGCHSGGFFIPEVTPEVRAATTRFYQNVGEDFVPGAGLYQLYTGQYFFSGDKASRVGGALASAPYFGPVIKTGTRVWRVARHADMPSPRPFGTQSHHGVNSVWMDANFVKYSAGKAPAILMPGPNHVATFGVFNRWRKEIARRQGVGILDVDYSKVSPGEAWRLAEEQLDAANVPLDLREAYFDAFNDYLQLLQ